MSTETVTIPAEAREVIEGVRGLKDSTAAMQAEQKALQERLAAVEAKMKADGIHLNIDERDAKKYSVGKALRAYLTNDWSDAGFELDVHKESWKRLDSKAMERTMTTLTPSLGGFLIPNEVSSVIIPVLDTQSVCKKLGATVVKPNGWPFRVNKITAGTTAAYANEGAAPSATDLTLGAINFSPRKMSARTVITAEQVAYGTPQTDALVVADLVKRLDLLQDYWALVGTGQQGQPLGVTNTSGINTTTGIKSGQLVYADLAIGIQYLEEDKVATDKLGLAINPIQKGELFRNVNATAASGTLANEGAAFVFNTPFMTPVMFKNLTGCDIAPTTQMTDGTAVLGVWEYLWMAEWGGLVIGRSDIASDGTNHAFTQDLLHVKATKWCDSAVVQPVAFHAITSI